MDINLEKGTMFFMSADHDTIVVGIFDGVQDAHVRYFNNLGELTMRPLKSIGGYGTEGVTWASGTDYELIFDTAVEIYGKTSGVDFAALEGAAHELALCETFLEKRFGEMATTGMCWMEAITAKADASIPA